MLSSLMPTADPDFAPHLHGRTVPPPVGVVMPILNEERHLKEAVDAVLGQTYEGAVQLVLALGPSRDRTDQIARAIAAEDSRVTTVANPSGRTPDALNAALGAL